MTDSFADHGIDVPGGASGEVDTTCPECSPQRKKKRDRCLSVNVDEGTWHCHHCGWAGGLRKAEVKDHPAKPKAYKRPQPKEQTISDKARQWLNGRGIPDEVIDRNRVGSQEIWMPQTESEVMAVAFPYYRDGTLINCKYRDGRKNFRMEAGAERILYGLDDLNPELGIITEGEMDKLSLEAGGYTSVVSVPDGAPSPESTNYASKFTFLEADLEKIQGVKKWIIASDNDKPGERLKDELSRRLGREKCWTVSWPQGCKDANDVLTKHGTQALAQCIANAAPYPIEGAFSVRDLSSKIYSLYENGWERGYSTGWKVLDDNYTVRPGEFTVVTGVPNSGKSNWIDALCVNLARSAGWNIGMFTPENQPLEDHMARIIEKYTRTPFYDGPTPRIGKEQMDAAMGWANEHFTWILPDDDADWTLDRIIDTAKQLVYRKGIRGLVIDPWNELEHMRPGNMSETEYIGLALKRMRQFARRYGVHVWVVVHPQKLHRQSDGSYPVPTMYDCHGSAHWRNKADNGICIWRDFHDSRSAVEIHVQKIRFRQVGQIGSVELGYVKETGTYKNVA